MTLLLKADWNSVLIFSRRPTPRLTSNRSLSSLSRDKKPRQPTDQRPFGFREIKGDRRKNEEKSELFQRLAGSEKADPGLSRAARTRCGADARQPAFGHGFAGFLVISDRRSDREAKI